MCQGRCSSKRGSSTNAGAVPMIRDPMDRLILAAARVTGGRLITVDDSLGGYGVDVIWA